jgi:hypothetical protein
MRIKSICALIVVIISFSFTIPVETVYQNTFILAKEKPFVSADKSFQIIFTGEPSYNSEIVSTDVGDVEMVNYMYEKSSEEVFMVAYSDYNEGFGSSNDSKTLLEGARDGALGSLGMEKIKDQQFTKHQGYPALYFTADSEEYSVVYKCIIVNDRLYQVAVLASNKILTKKETKPFLKSFKII